MQLWAVILINIDNNYLNRLLFQYYDNYSKIQAQIFKLCTGRRPIQPKTKQKIKAYDQVESENSKYI